MEDSTHIQKKEIEISEDLLCPHCGDQKSRSDNLKRHIKSCEKRMMSNKFKCDKCNKKFAHKTSMYRHRKSHNVENNV